MTARRLASLSGCNCRQDKLPAADQQAWPASKGNRVGSHPESHQLICRHKLLLVW